LKLKTLVPCILLLWCAALRAESWTVLVYMAADNNLEQMGKLDINSMESVPQPAGLNLIVQADFPQGAARYKIGQDNSTSITSPVLADLGYIDSGNPNTLNSFIKWGFNRYPAQRKMLVIWSHGNSWYKGNESKWICPDDGAQNLMSISNGDMQIAFAGAPQLDVLLFDACSMQSIEILTEVHPYAYYVIGSEELVPINGFPYETIIPLFEDSFSEILDQIPQLYVQSYLPGEGINPGNELWTTTCSAIETLQIPLFNTLYKEFVRKYRNLLASEIMVVRENCYEMNDGMADIDLKQFLELLSANGTPEVLLLKQLWNSMVYSYDATTPDPLGLGIGTAALWFPDGWYNFNNGWPLYYNLDFAETQWLSLINIALGEDIYLPAPPDLISQNLVLGTLHLQIRPSADPDSLYYELLASSWEKQFFYPLPFSSVFSISFQVSQAGSYAITAIDQSGNRSAALSGSYGYTEPEISVIVNPNPIRGKELAVLRWWADDSLSGKVRLELFNFKGQLVLSHQLGEVQAGEGSYLLANNPEFGSLIAGRYFLRLHIGSKHFTKRITILY